MEQTAIPPARSRTRRALRASGLVLAAAVAVTVAPAELAAAQDAPPPPPERPMKLFDGPRGPRDAPAPAPAPAARVQETGFLGVSIENLDAGEASELGLSEPRGVRIRKVLGDSPAAEAGLREGDVLLEWNGESARSVAQLRRLVRETPPGRTARVSYLRNGEHGRVSVTVGEGPDRMVRTRALEMSDEERREMREQLQRAREQVVQAREQWREHAEEAREQVEEAREEAEEARRHALVELRRVRAADEDGLVRAMAGLRGPRIGVRLNSLTDQLADYFGLGDRSGALVVSVADDSPARDAGIRAGDVLLAVGSSTVESPGDAARLVREHEGQDTEIEVLRRGERLTVTVSVPEAEEAAMELRLREMQPAIRGSLEGIAPRLRRIKPGLRRALHPRGEVII